MVLVDDSTAYHMDVRTRVRTLRRCCATRGSMHTLVVGPRYQTLAHRRSDSKESPAVHFRFA